MQETFDKELSRLLPASDEIPSVLLAVSGGIDSMCMAYLYLHTSVKIKFSVAHVNFSLRGEESDGDEALVGEWCNDNGIEFFSNKFDTHQYADYNSISTQMAARELRYSWFFMLMEKHSIDYLSVAHNLNDSVETLFLNVLRGTGLRGLSGIRETNGMIIRPLLSFTRAQIASFVEEKNIQYREDRTNSESHYMRNKVRNQVFPYFAAINPSFLATVNTEMRRFGEVEDIMEEQYKLRENILYKVENGVLLIDIEALKKEKFRGYWLYRILCDYGFNDTQISQIDQALNSQSGKTFNSEEYILVRDREYLKVYPAADEEAVPEVKISVFAKPANFNPKRASADGTLYVDGKKVTFPLKCRKWKPADKFRPLGMTGYKKLSDFFTDLKLDIKQKQQQIVVTTIDKKGEEQIVCVVGKRIDDRYKITAVTKQIISISLK